MADPTSIQSQSTNRLPFGEISPDTYRVLIRGRERINTLDYTLVGTRYSASVTVDLGQFNVSVLPMIEFYTNESNIIKGPYVLVGSTGLVTSYVNAFISAGTKSGLQSTKITFAVSNNHGGQIDIFYQVLSLPAAGDLFP